MRLTKEKAQQIIYKRLIAQIPRDIEIQDGVPEGCVFYGVDKVKSEPCFIARIPPEIPRTGPSRIICVSKKTCRIIYDGLTCDE